MELVAAGESPSMVARILGVHETSIHRWRRLARTEAGLDAKPHKGPTPGLSDEQLAEIAGGNCTPEQLSQVVKDLKDSYDTLVDFTSYVIERVAG